MESKTIKRVAKELGMFLFFQIKTNISFEVFYFYFSQIKMSLLCELHVALSNACIMFV